MPHGASVPRLRVRTMTNVKIGIQTLGLRQPLRQAIQTAARLGVDGIELDLRSELPPASISQTGLRQLRFMLDDSRLRVSAATFPTRRGYDDSNDLDRRISATQTAMRLARQLHADVLINRLGYIADRGEESGFQRLLESLTAIATFGDRIGVRFAAQTGSEGPQHLARLVDALPEHTVGIDLHPAGLIAAGSSPQEALESLGPHIVHVHACDAVRLFDGRARPAELGRGMADFPEILGRLSEFDYRGWVTIETVNAANPITEAENAIAYLRSL